MAHSQPLRPRFAFSRPGAESSTHRYSPESLFFRRLKNATKREVGRAWLLASIFMPMYKHLTGIVADSRSRAVRVVFPAPSGPINATLNMRPILCYFSLSGKKLRCAPHHCVTMKLSEEVVVPVEVVMLIGPLVAPVGT